MVVVWASGSHALKPGQTHIRDEESSPMPPIRSSRLPLALTLLLAFASAAFAATDDPAATTRMLRSPTVSASQIAFAYAQNIWIVPRAGGEARRLTSFQGQAGNPRFSPDGKWVAFSGEYAGNLDVYVVSAEGGEPKRLTWHPGA